MNASLDNPSGPRSTAEAVDSEEALALERSFTVRETAKVLGRCPDTVRRHVRSGRLAGVRVGRIWRVPASVLLASGLVAQSGLAPLRDDEAESNEEEARGKRQ